MSINKKKIKVGVVGGTGYTGVELLRLLSKHPNAELYSITSRSEHGLAVSKIYPNLSGFVDLKFSTPDEANLGKCDVVFFATPHGVAMTQAKNLLENNVKIIDLAADFRLSNIKEFEKWYKIPHACPDLLKESSVYGLVEINREAIKKAKIVGNPGCYPTTIILGLAPLIQGKLLIDLQTVIADCKSGISGAGRKAEIGSLLCEASENFRAYSVFGHRHTPEILAQVEKISGEKANITFIPHLVPMIRGMFSTLYVRILPEFQEIDFQLLFEKFYKAEYFVNILPQGDLPSTNSVRGSNNLCISLCRKTKDLLIIFVSQDNLVKGAAGQAVQNMNVLFNLDESTGLDNIAFFP